LSARQNPFSRFEELIRNTIEGLFARLFPSQLEPVEIQRRLENAMEDKILIQGEGRKLAPNVYDIYLSIKDHQQLAPSQSILIRDWQTHLVEFARQRRYTLKTMPILRLHADSSLGTGTTRIHTEQECDADGGMTTNTISSKQLTKLRADLPSGQNLPGIAFAPAGNAASKPPEPGSGRSATAPVVLPKAWLTIRLPQAGQQIFQIEKSVVNIGRQLTNDIIVEDKRVSRFHAQIKYQTDGQFAIFDLGSTNGITINNQPNMRHHVLRNGDKFTIGSYDFNFERR